MKNEKAVFIFTKRKNNLFQQYQEQFKYEIDRIMEYIFNLR